MVQVDADCRAEAFSSFLLNIYIYIFLFFFPFYLRLLFLILTCWYVLLFFFFTQMRCLKNTKRHLRGLLVLLLSRIGSHSVFIENTQLCVLLFSFTFFFSPHSVPKGKALAIVLCSLFFFFVVSWSCFESQVELL